MSIAPAALRPAKPNELRDLELDQYAKRLQLFRSPEVVHEDTFSDDIAAGLTADQKHIPPKHLYDDRGAQLFEQICDQPEYYLTRTERRILTDNVDDIANALEDVSVLTELGAGSAAKTEKLLSGWVGEHDSGDACTYNPNDISAEMIRMCADRVLPQFDSLNFTAFLCDYETALHNLRRVLPERKAILFLGSSIGNMSPGQREQFLRMVRGAMTGPEDAAVIGMDMDKDPEVLVAAYDDAAGVTAAFEKNILEQINTRLGGEFDLDAFDYEARYDANVPQIQMSLISKTDQTVPIRDLDLAVAFESGERIHTEVSAKFRPKQIDDLCESVDLTVERHWSDSDDWFRLCKLRPASAVA